MRVATFNLQNLRLRVRDGTPVLDGAADRDSPVAGASAELDLADRRETARVITAAQADVVALQEVFDQPALDYFHDAFLAPAGACDYPHRFCLPGNDGRGLNVAALCSRSPVRVTSHAELTAEDLGLTGIPKELRGQRLFRRDCLEVEFDGLSLFICHFKAPYPDAAKAQAVRAAEAGAVRKIVETRFGQPDRNRWIILGDFNEPAAEQRQGHSSLEPLQSGFAVDLLDRLRTGEDWTYEVPGTHLHSRPDRILVSPLLAEEYPDAVPQIIRSGMERRPGPGPHASDHALVYADFPGL